MTGHNGETATKRQAKWIEKTCNPRILYPCKLLICECCKKIFSNTQELRKYAIQGLFEKNISENTNQSTPKWMKINKSIQLLKSIKLKKQRISGGRHLFKCRINTKYVILIAGTNVEEY